MKRAKKAAKKSERTVPLTVKVTQRDYERLCLLRARTHKTALDILEEALRKALDDADV